MKNITKYGLWLMTLCLVLLTACGGRNSENGQTNGNGEEFTGARYVRTALATIGNIERVLNYSGHVKFEQAVNIMPNMAGRIDRIDAREGQRVNQGQVLAIIDQISLSQAEANFRLAESNFRRIETLLAQNVTDQRSFDEAELQFINARTSYELARENLEIKAPFSGTITQSNFRVNDNYSPSMGQPLFRLISNRDIYIDVNVSSVDAMQLRVNQSVRVSSEGRSYEAFIAFISPENDLITGLNRVRVEFRTPQNHLRNNQFALIDFIPESKENVLLIPRAALIRDNTAILSVDGRAMHRNIQTGMESRDFIEVINGLRDGDRVVIEGVSGLVDNSLIIELGS